MSHELSIQNGRAEMFSGRNLVPWHKLGTVVSGLLTAEAALDAAHLNWRAVKRPVSCGGQVVTDYNAIVRDDTNAVLSIMPATYHPIDNIECFNFFDSVVGKGQAVYDTAGALRGGRKVWIMARLPGHLFIRGDDKVEKMVLLSTSHDGQSLLQLQQVTTRVVCANTIRIALAGATNTIKILHRANYKARVEEAQRALELSNGYFDDLASVLKTLAKAPFAKSEMRDLSEVLLPSPEDKRPSKPVIEARLVMQGLFTGGLGNQGTSKWDALNAVTEFVDHSRKYTKSNVSSADEIRFTSTLFGSGANLKQTAFTLLSGCGNN